jgi:hypothetical protein
MISRLVVIALAALAGWTYGRWGNAFWMPMTAAIGSLWLVEQFYLDRHRT